MAEHLASIFGTEKDKVNCSFYYKIGACRHGERCSRIHNKPTLSETIILPNLYYNPSAHLANLEGQTLEVDEKEQQNHFDSFYEDVFNELSNYGEIEEMQVCDNLGDHLNGNVYVKFYRDEDAEKALKALNGRFYAGRPVVVEFSPVTDFREARCRQYDMGECSRGGYCNFMHLKETSRDLRRKLFGHQRKSRSNRSRSRSPHRKSRSPHVRRRSRSPHVRRRSRSPVRRRSRSPQRIYSRSPSPYHTRRYSPRYLDHESGRHREYERRDYDYYRLRERESMRRYG